MDSRDNRTEGRCFPSKYVMRPVCTSVEGRAPRHDRHVPRHEKCRGAGGSRGGEVHRGSRVAGVAGVCGGSGGGGGGSRGVGGERSPRRRGWRLRGGPLLAKVLRGEVFGRVVRHRVHTWRLRAARGAVVLAAVRPRPAVRRALPPGRTRYDRARSAARPGTRAEWATAPVSMRNVRGERRFRNWNAGVSRAGGVPRRCGAARRAPGRSLAGAALRGMYVKGDVTRQRGPRHRRWVACERERPRRRLRCARARLMRDRNEATAFVRSI
ncbi:unnamed protein product, partial [Iphiclides podalirius]